MMRYLVMLLLALNIGYFGWNLLRPPEPPAGAIPAPLRNEGLRLLGEARPADGATAGRVCLFASGFEDIFAASEFAAAAASGELEATVHTAAPGDRAGVRLERIAPEVGALPQWPDFARQSPGLTVVENPCEGFAPGEDLH